MFLTRLIYASRITESFSNSSIEHIIRKASEDNVKNHITGMLCFNSNYFLQCLEGARTQVNQTYKRILNDERHTDITLLYYDEIAVRDFADWSMGYVPSSSLSSSINLKFSGCTDFNPYKISGDGAFKMMLELKKLLPSIE
ncbi:MULTISPECIES: BLUF domain-containing protein [unclassified Pseudoalteromonas]|uniref:BLUF domain-containing protein n=1 Tax=unclassified Pseudoalteromonas TaxID=194690 RepID=UPI000C08B317|nr:MULTISPECIES: BLUF domain-containing protein [unclassified Pseudoalteromonas]MDP2636511.1 BLUF domain-containing protein [Pseudoalteromonas sp. 1_MG-2023]PHN90173.1 blue light sensor protein [Pseudoalteromonas sp. 3D05]